METLAVTDRIREKFWARVRKTETCWLWTGGKTRGYAHLRLDGKAIYGHRFAYQLENGPLAPSQILDHICHTPACVRPDHLRVVTPKQNCENKRGANSSSKSGVRGVFWVESRGKWRATMTHNKRLHFVGEFASLEDAAKSAAAKRNELFTHNNADRMATR